MVNTVALTCMGFDATLRVPLGDSKFEVRCWRTLRTIWFDVRRWRTRL